MKLLDQPLPGEVLFDESVKAQSERGARTILAAALRRKRLAASILALGLLGSLLVIRSLAPTYTAMAILEVNPNKSAWTNFNEGIGNNLQPDPMYVHSEVNLLQSRATAGRVVDRLGLTFDAEFNPLLRPSLASRLISKIEEVWQSNGTATKDDDPRGVAARGMTIDGVLSHLTAENDNRSYTINVQFSSHDAAKASTIANAFAEEYIRLQVEAKTESVRRTYEWLSTRVPALREELQNADREIQQFRDEHNLARVEPNGTNNASQQLQEMTTQLVMAETNRAAAEANLDHARHAIHGNDANSIPEVLASPLIQFLKQEQATISRRIAELGQSYGDNYPLVKNARAELTDITRKIAAESDKVIAGMAQQVQSDKLRADGLRARMTALQSNLHASDRVHIQLQELESTAEAKRTLLKTLSERYEQASFLQNIAVPDTRIVGLAEVPARASGPNKILTAALGVIAALAALCSTMYFLERRDRGFRTVNQIENAIELPCVAMVPMLPDAGLLRRIVSARQHDRTRAIFAESVRMARTSVLYTNEKKSVRVIVVTSSLPDEGKSMFAAAFARSLVETGRRVLVIDGDLRHARLGQIMGASGRPGLQDVLAGRVSASDAICVDVKNRLHILPASGGAEGTDGTDGEIDANKMWRFLGELTMYDTIVIDTPPVLVVSDASSLARVADSVLYIVQWASTPRETVIAGIRRLRMVSEAPVKLVLSKVDLTDHARYGFKDESYYASLYEAYFHGQRRSASAIPSWVSIDEKPSFDAAGQ